MQISKLKSIIFLLIPSFLLLLTGVTCTNTNADTTTTRIVSCPTQVCTYDDPISRYVRFPFQIQNESLPQVCGYPGFDLFCDGSYQLSINLPNLGVFYVHAIDYINQEIWLKDPNNCLPKRLISHNLSSFDDSSYTIIHQLDQLYWLYNCSIDYYESLGHVKSIQCLSGLMYVVFASPYEDTSNSTTKLCNYLGTVQLPVGSNPRSVQSLDLVAGLRLSWVEPDCKGCYMKSGRCGFNNYSSLEVNCFDVPRHGIRKETIVAITLAFAAPSLFFACCITYYSIRAICGRRRRDNTIGVAIATLPTQQQQTVPMGLETSIIESYPKVILGESRRLPRPDENNCPICLGEYLAKDSLRSLPNCGHCFHSDCVDEWLRLNGSCPVCRNTPTSTPEITR
ncbi:hypothetical protein RND81_14G100400 [Saponaria officinalis]|uniref:RING-type E3 ubiquitin transferase n=1 Tax=Saponaria officinalis TaxID=3572 RepID=A0AAW1GL98_SAPOF